MQAIDNVTTRLNNLKISPPVPRKKSKNQQIGRQTVKSDFGAITPLSSIKSTKNYPTYPTGGTGTNQSPGRSSTYQLSDTSNRLKTKAEAKKDENDITQQVKQLYGAYTSNKTKAEPQNEIADKSEEVKPLLYIDVDIGENEQDRITVYSGNDPHLLASEFCLKHQIDDRETLAVLEEQLIQKIKKVKSKQIRDNMETPQPSDPPKQLDQMDFNIESNLKSQFMTGSKFAANKDLSPQMFSLPEKEGASSYSTFNRQNNVSEGKHYQEFREDTEITEITVSRQAVDNIINKDDVRSYRNATSTNSFTSNTVNTRAYSG